jgi:hypothetical protein
MVRVPISLFSLSFNKLRLNNAPSNCHHGESIRPAAFKLRCREASIRLKIQRCPYTEFFYPNFECSAHGPGHCIRPKQPGQRLGQKDLESPRFNMRKLPASLINWQRSWHTVQGYTPSGFSPTLTFLSEVDSELLSSLLAKYGQPTNGTITAKRKRLRSYIGLPELWTKPSDTAALAPGHRVTLIIKFILHINISQAFTVKLTGFLLLFSHYWHYIFISDDMT